MILRYVSLFDQYRTHNRQVPCSSQGGATIFKGLASMQALTRTRKAKSGDPSGDPKPPASLSP